MNRLQRLAGASVALGIAAGGVVALTYAGGAPERPVRPDAFRALPGTLRQAPAGDTTGVQPGSGRLRLHRGSLVTELRRADPAGGAPWVVRSFVADLVYPKSVGVRGPVRSPMCMQLGREVDGQFGWIDATNTFRSVPIGSQNTTPTSCGSIKRDVKRDPDLQLTTPISDPLSPDARVLGSVVWGSVGGQVAGASLTAAGRSQRIAPTRGRGAYLAFVGPRRTSADAKLTVRYPDGTQTRVGTPGSHAFPMPEAMRLVGSTARLAARTSDPGGGPSWGMTEVRTRGGWWCAQAAGYLVDGRVGSIEPGLGLLSDVDPSQLARGCPKPGDFTRKMPIWSGTSSGLETAKASLDPGRGPLRLMPGRFILTGQTSPDVRLVRVESPRDVRSVVPTGASHAFLVVYDGDFQTGSILLTAIYRDGHTASVRVSTGL